MAEDQTVKSVQQLHAESRDNYQTMLMDGVVPDTEHSDTPAGVSAPVSGSTSVGGEVTRTVNVPTGSTQVQQPRVNMGEAGPTTGLASVVAPALPEPVAEDADVPAEVKALAALGITAEDVQAVREWRASRNAEPTPTTVRGPEAQTMQPTYEEARSHTPTLPPPGA